MLVVTSQPLAALRSQSAKPAAQRIAHTPLAQLAVPWVESQTVPHAPQLAASVPMAVSQPLLTGPAQWAKPAWHVVTAHVPAAQLVVAWGNAQALPHAPQFVLVVSGDSQPVATLLSQSPKPGLHVIWQAPAVHCEVAVCAVEHTLRHRPQLPASVVSVISQPLAGLASQSAKPAPHTMPQTPPEQLALPCVAVHTLPQAPQLATSETMRTSQPLAAALSQSA